MNDLQRALGDIRNLRRNLAAGTEFRGYGPLTLAATSLFAIAAGFAQARWASSPGTSPLHYAVVWALTALVSAALVVTQTLNRAHRLHSGLADEMLRLAALQFLPAAVAGALATVVIVRATPQNLWLLPAIWQIVYALGIFASCRFLPRAMLAAGVWFLAAGMLTLSLGDARTLSPRLLPGIFAIGQLLIAAVLYLRSTESTDDEI